MKPNNLTNPILSTLAQKKLEILLEEESKNLPLRERRKYLVEVRDYILNICPRHYKFKCEECKEDCKGYSSPKRLSAKSE